MANILRHSSPHLEPQQTFRESHHSRTSISLSPSVWGPSMISEVQQGDDPLDVGASHSIRDGKKNSMEVMKSNANFCCLSVSLSALKKSSGAFYCKGPLLWEKSFNQKLVVDKRLIIIPLNATVNVCLNYSSYSSYYN